ncbi:type VI secretion system baseplate subunit TssK [Pigmentibacter sp. JX0631]|uniref:type VI secretion system baseplate subunit TssK n=1 Tax=Pigmentibacter sp. JX0631 TaxID=2976982 RepID=UPI0024695DFA|nr:type VI secretion system baseplate subunit TssK [Pigmentibacter sp. JX0631]WGL60324.1 type VI secretion system baseplate subunit TssK [Pigmentibacter sp. JX0631]
MNFNQVPEMIQWHEGMPLLPHHFQQLNLRYEALVNSYFTFLDINKYGIIKLDIDQIEIIRNVYSINYVEAIMQDGLYIKSGKSEKEKLTFNLPDPSSNKQKISLFLCVPKLSEKNYVLGHYPRYISSTIQHVEDLNTLSDPIQISSLTPNVFIAAENELNSQLNKIKLCDLHVQNGTWQFKEYIPAQLFLEKSSYLYKRCLDIVHKTRIKANIISDNLNNIENKYSQINESFLFLISLNQILPLFEFYLTCDRVTPFQLYELLIKLLAALSQLNENFIAQTPIVYDHQNLQYIFEKNLELVNQLLEKSISDKYYSILFQENGFKYVLDIPQSKLNSVIYIGIKRSIGDNESNSIEWLSNAIICDENKLDIFIRNRVLGYKRNKMEKVQNIVPARGVTIFELVLENFTNENFKLCIFNDNKSILKPEEIFFYQKK